MLWANQQNKLEVIQPKRVISNSQMFKKPLTVLHLRAESEVLVLHVAILFTRSTSCAVLSRLLLSVPARRRGTSSIEATEADCTRC